MAWTKSVRSKRVVPAPEPEADKPSPNEQAALDWHRLKSKKGWTNETLLLMFYEFVKERGLFAALLEFAGRRK